MHKLVHPQEVEVFYLLPALRRDMAVSLKELGRDQKQIAKILGVSEPSVSHYFNAKRAQNIEFSPTIKNEIKRTAESIKTPQDTIKETQRLLRIIHTDKEICKVCHDLNKAQISPTCAVCYD